MSGRPGLYEMIRAKFLLGMITPVTVGTLTSVSITGELNLFGLLLVFTISISLQMSMHVYNDIYDTELGSDSKESQRSGYSGGSGVLLDHPELKPKMFLIARTGLLISASATIILLTIIDRELWPLLILVVGASMFLTKYYTAPPVKFAYRGVGEIVVWIAFGPLVILLSSIGQNLGFHPTLLAVMPLTGFGAVFISWMGELVDFEWDKAAGKKGVVMLLGHERSNYIFFLIHTIVVLNVVYVALLVFNPGYPILIAVVPHIVIFPKYWYYIWNYKETENIKKAARLNFWLYTTFSLSLLAGFILNYLL